MKSEEKRNGRGVGNSAKSLNHFSVPFTESDQFGDDFPFKHSLFFFFSPESSVFLTPKLLVCGGVDSDGDD